MNEFEKDEDKRLMLEKMREKGWEINEDSSYEDVKENFEEMMEEFDFIEYNMYPNGRDYDSENFDD